jgi:hypothetical protein
LEKEYQMYHGKNHHHHHHHPNHDENNDTTTTSAIQQEQVSATDFVQDLLQYIMQHDDPLPESGFRYMIRCATPQWKRALYASVGAPPTAPEDIVASALGEAMQRPNNQYALLTGDTNDDDDDQENRKNEHKEHYYVTFPYEPLDYYDGSTVYVECQLRHPNNHDLLAILGFSLLPNHRDEQGSATKTTTTTTTTTTSWLLDGMDWQDFREKFRPGIGYVLFVCL